MRINNVDHFGQLVDLWVVNGVITALASKGTLPSDDRAWDALGGALLPGLSDHHIHLCASAAATQSVACGPPLVENPEQLRAALCAADARLPPQAWLRGVGYHDSVAGVLDRHTLDAICPDRPLRIQHRSGRMWLLNSVAIRHLRALPSAGLAPPDLDSGRLFDADTWMRATLRTVRPNLGPLSRQLASYGVIACTDASPGNGRDDQDFFAARYAQGELLQRLRLMGTDDLHHAADGVGVSIGERKFHLHEAELPDIQTLITQISASHKAGRSVAFHAVTRTELLFALAALQAAGSRAGDRIEHLGVAPPETLPMLQEQGLTVISQPHFIAERGDAYLRDVDADDQPWLYPLRRVQQHHIPLAAGSDAPFGGLNPWVSMAAAVSRRTPQGVIIGASEALTPEAALALYTGTLKKPAQPCVLQVGGAADFCIATQSWAHLRQNLAATQVQLTVADGRILHAAPTVAAYWGVAPL